ESTRCSGAAILVHLDEDELVEGDEAALVAGRDPVDGRVEPRLAELLVALVVGRQALVVDMPNETEVRERGPVVPVDEAAGGWLPSCVNVRGAPVAQLNTCGVNGRVAQVLLVEGHVRNRHPEREGDVALDRVAATAGKGQRVSKHVQFPDRLRRC